MKSLEPLFIVLLVSLLAATGSAQSTAEPRAPKARVVTVTGYAQVSAKPDVVLITARAVNFGNDAEKAKLANDRTLTQIRAVVKELGIPPEHVHEGAITVSPTYSKGSGDGGYKYRVVNGVALQLDAASDVEKVVSKLLSAGADDVDREYQSTSEQVHRTRAREKALDAAKTKAQAMIAKYGGELGAVLEIVEESDREPYGYRRVELPDLDYRETAWPGMFGYVARLRVTFAIK